MAIISRRIMTPRVGKTELAVERCRKLVAIMTRVGARATLRRVVMGEDAGNLEVYGMYSDFNSGTKVSIAITTDPEYKALGEAREKDPAAEMAGPYVYRTVFGEPSPHPVTMQRVYQVSRSNLKNLIGLLPELRTVVGANNPFTAAIPAIAPNMDSMVIAYYADSLETLGRNLDEIGMSDRFQNLTEQAAKYGALVSSRVLVAI